MPTFKITTLGCKVNQYDAQAAAALLVAAGLTPAQAAGGAGIDLVVIQTCCVTAAAMRKSRLAIRKALRQAPAADVLVLGCYSDYDSSGIRQALAHANLAPQRLTVAGHHDDLAAVLTRLAQRLTGRHTPQPTRSRPTQSDTLDALPNMDFGNTGAEPGDPTNIKARRLSAVKRNVRAAAGLPAIRAFPGHQRAFVKVQDGCDAFCTYCIVPYTRCRVWSRDISEILAECRGLLAAGHREIVLSGVFLGAFGRQTAIRRRWPAGPAPLAALLEQVAQLPGLWRTRLSSLEPGDMGRELLEVCRRYETVAPHFHLPLQSGSAGILRKMNRQYTPDDYRRMLDAVRRAFDRPAITTDIIVGFPGESDGDFADTLALAREAGFARIHAFAFSALEPTAAWLVRHHAPPPPVVAQRLAQLAELDRELSARYHQGFVGSVVEAIVEGGREPDGRRRAMTDRHVPVLFPPPPHARLTGQVRRFGITAAGEAGLEGCALPAESSDSGGAPPS